MHINMKSENPTLKKTFKRFNLNHTYRSTMSSAYTTNLGYEGDDEGRPTATDQGEHQDYISQRQFNTVTISEQLSPLVGVDMSIKTANDNEPQIRVEITRDRNINLGLICGFRLIKHRRRIRFHPPWACKKISTAFEYFASGFKAHLNPFSLSRYSRIARICNFLLSSYVDLGQYMPVIVRYDLFDNIPGPDFLSPYDARYLHHFAKLAL